MTWKLYGVVSLCVVAAVAAYEMYRHYVDKREKEKQGEEEKKTSAQEPYVIFFPSRNVCSNVPFTQRFSELQKCAGYKHLKEIFRNAKKSIYLCIFTLSSKPLCGVLVECMQRGVDVRVVADANNGEERESMLRELRPKGVLVRSYRSPYLMHHKFCVVDEELAMTGSFNWTTQAMLCNRENLLIIPGGGLAVKQYLKEFHELWEEALKQRYDET